MFDAGNLTSLVWFGKEKPESNLGRLRPMPTVLLPMLGNFLLNTVKLQNLTNKLLILEYNHICIHLYILKHISHHIKIQTYLPS